MAVESSTGRCPICLEPIIGESYLDHCFHKFCFHCILQWSEMVLARSYSIRPLPLDCPLCKTHYFSIIHNCVGTSFQRHYVVNDKQTSSKRSFKSEAHMRRLAVYVQNSDYKVINENILESSTQSREFVKSGKKVMQHAPSNQWLHCWICRELQALMQEEDVNIVVHHVVGIFESFQRRKGNVLVPGKVNLQSTSWLSAVSTAVRPFIFEHADKFSLELEKFLFSRLDIAAYDQLTSLQCSKLPHFDSTFLEDTAMTTERLEVSRQQPEQVKTLHCAEHQEKNHLDMEDKSRLKGMPDEDTFTYFSDCTSQQRKTSRSFCRKHKQRKKKNNCRHSKMKNELQIKKRRIESHRKVHHSNVGEHSSSSSYSNTSKCRPHSSPCSQHSNSSSSSSSSGSKDDILRKRSSKFSKRTSKASINAAKSSTGNYVAFSDKNGGSRVDTKKNKKGSMAGIKNQSGDFRQSDTTLVDFSMAASPVLCLEKGEILRDREYGMLVEDAIKQEENMSHDSARFPQNTELQNAAHQVGLFEVHLRQQALMNLKKYRAIRQEKATVREATIICSETFTDLKASKMSSTEKHAEISFARDTSIKCEPAETP